MVISDIDTVLVPVLIKVKAYR